jgi:hypothetical protein
VIKLVSIKSARSLIGETVRKLEGYRPYGELYKVTNEWLGDQVDEYGQWQIQITDKDGNNEFTRTDRVARWDKRVSLNSSAEENNRVIGLQQAAEMFSSEGECGEADAISQYCIQAANLLAKGQNDIYENIMERVSDELNHLLGDLLDGIKLGGLRISSDGGNTVKILDELKKFVSDD